MNNIYIMCRQTTLHSNKQTSKIKAIGVMKSMTKNANMFTFLKKQPPKKKMKNTPNANTRKKHTTANSLKQLDTSLPWKVKKKGHNVPTPNQKLIHTKQS